jgi:hypothetical protein
LTPELEAGAALDSLSPADRQHCLYLDWLQHPERDFMRSWLHGHEVPIDAGQIAARFIQLPKAVYILAGQFFSAIA